MLTGSFFDNYKISFQIFILNAGSLDSHLRHLSFSHLFTE